MKVSVITVCYNSASTIGEALDSVAAQTWPDVEHIVVDGASSDGTQDIVRGRNTKVVHFISEPDKGIYDAMNKGIALASGDIICILNADDVYPHDLVLSQVVHQMQSRQLDALLGDIAFFHSNDPAKLFRRYNSGRFSPDRIAWGWMPAHPGLFLKREVYDRVGYFRTDYRIAGDFEFVARIFSNGQLCYEHFPEVLVKMRAGGVSTGGWRNTVLLNKEVLRACRENGISTNWLKILSKYPAKLVEYFQ